MALRCPVKVNAALQSSFSYKHSSLTQTLHGATAGTILKTADEAAKEKKEKEERRRRRRDRKNKDKKKDKGRSSSSSSSSSTDSSEELKRAKRKDKKLEKARLPLIEKEASYKSFLAAQAEEERQGSLRQQGEHIRGVLKPEFDALLASEPRRFRDGVVPRRSGRRSSRSSSSARWVLGTRAPTTQSSTSRTMPCSWATPRRRATPCATSWRSRLWRPRG